jgi:hypothetical protein
MGFKAFAVCFHSILFLKVNKKIVVANGIPAKSSVSTWSEDLILSGVADALISDTGVLRAFWVFGITITSFNKRESLAGGAG